MTFLVRGNDAVTAKPQNETQNSIFLQIQMLFLSSYCREILVKKATTNWPLYHFALLCVQVVSNILCFCTKWTKSFHCTKAWQGTNDEVFIMAFTLPFVHKGRNCGLFELFSLSRPPTRTLSWMFWQRPLLKYTQCELSRKNRKNYLFDGIFRNNVRSRGFGRFCNCVRYGSHAALGVPPSPSDTFQFAHYVMQQDVSTSGCS